MIKVYFVMKIVIDLKHILDRKLHDQQQQSIQQLIIVLVIYSLI